MESVSVPRGSFEVLDRSSDSVDDVELASIKQNLAVHHADRLADINAERTFRRRLGSPAHHLSRALVRIQLDPPIPLFVALP
jgi:hypothetical protein